MPTENPTQVLDRIADILKNYRTEQPQAAASDARASATYEDAGAILEEAKQIQLHLASQDAAIGVLLDKIKTLEEHTSAI